MSYLLIDKVIQYGVGISWNLMKHFHTTPTPPLLLKNEPRPNILRQAEHGMVKNRYFVAKTSRTT